MRNKVILTLSTLAVIGGGVYALPNHSNNSTYTSPDPTSPSSLDQPTNANVDPLSPAQSTTGSSEASATDQSSSTNTSTPATSPSANQTPATQEVAPAEPVVVSNVASIDEDLKSTCVLTYSDGTTSSYEWRRVIVNRTSTGEIRNELLVAICNDSLVGQPKS